MCKLCKTLRWCEQSGGADDDIIDHPGMEHWPSNWAAVFMLRESLPKRDGLKPADLPASIEDGLPPVNERVLELPFRELVAA